MELELKVLKGYWSDSPLQACFDSDDSVTPAACDDAASITSDIADQW